MCIRPFLSAKRGDIVSIMAYILLLGLQIGPKWPKLSQNDPQKSPPTTVYLWPVQLYLIWRYFSHLGQEKSQNLPINGFNNSLLGLQMESNLPWIPPKWLPNTPTVLYSCGQYSCKLFGGIHVIFGWRKWCNQTKILNFDNWHCMFF